MLCIKLSTIILLFSSMGCSALMEARVNRSLVENESKSSAAALDWENKFIECVKGYAKSHKTYSSAPQDLGDASISACRHELETFTHLRKIFHESDLMQSAKSSAADSARRAEWMSKKDGEELAARGKQEVIRIIVEFTGR